MAAASTLYTVPPGARSQPGGHPDASKLPSVSSISNVLTPESFSESLREILEGANSHAYFPPHTAHHHTLKSQYDRLMEQMSPIVLGLIPNELHILNSVILPAKISDNIHFRTRAVEFISTLPTRNPEMGVNRTIQRVEHESTSTLKRYGLHFFMTKDVEQLPEGILDIQRNLYFIAALNCRLMAVLAVQAMCEYKASGNDSTDLIQEKAVYTQMIIESRDLFALPHKSSRGLPTLINTYSERIQARCNGIRPTYAVCPMEKRALVRDNERFTDHYIAGKDKISLWQNEDTLNTFISGVTLISAPELPDAREEYTQLMNDVRIGNFAMFSKTADMDVSNPEQIGWYIYDMPLDKWKFITVRDAIRGIPFIKMNGMGVVTMDMGRIRSMGDSHRVAPGDLPFHGHGSGRTGGGDDDDDDDDDGGGFRSKRRRMGDDDVDDVDTDPDNNPFRGDPFHIVLLPRYVVAAMYRKLKNPSSPAPSGGSAGSVPAPRPPYGGRGTAFLNAARSPGAAFRSFMSTNLMGLAASTLPTGHHAARDVMSAELLRERREMEARLKAVEKSLADKKAEYDTEWAALSNEDRTAHSSGKSIPHIKDIDDEMESLQQQISNLKKSLRTLADRITSSGTGGAAPSPPSPPSGSSGGGGGGGGDINEFLDLLDYLRGLYIELYGDGDIAINGAIFTALYEFIDKGDSSGHDRIDFIERYWRPRGDHVPHYFDFNRLRKQLNGAANDPSSEFDVEFISWSNASKFLDDVDLVAVRPLETLCMQSLILAIPGEETGFTVMSNPTLTHSEDGSMQTVMVNSNGWYGIHISNPNRFDVIRNGFYHRSYGGSNARIIEGDNVSILINNNFSITDETFPSVYMLAVPKGSIREGPFFEIRGYGPCDAPAARSEHYYNGCRFWNAYYGWNRSGNNMSYEGHFHNTVAHVCFATTLRYMGLGKTIIEIPGQTHHGKGEGPGCNIVRRKGINMYPNLSN